MRIKLAIAIASGVLVLTVLVALKITSLGGEERSQILFSSVQNETGLAKINTDLLAKRYAELLTQAASMEEAGRISKSAENVNSLFNSSPFLTMALLEPDDVTGWNLRWLKNKKNGDGGWISADEQRIKKELPLAMVNSENIIWHRHLSSTGHALYSFLIQVELPTSTVEAGKKLIALAVLNNQAFSGVIESFKSTTREVMVLDDKGHALAYTSQQYVGAPLTSHPMVERLLAERRVDSVGEYKDRSGDQVIGAYEQLDGSNLYVAVAQKLGSFPSLFSAQLISLLGLAVASFLIAISLGFILVRPTIAAYEYLQDLAIALGQGLPLRQPASFAEMPPVLMESIQRLHEDPSLVEVGELQNLEMKSSEVADVNELPEAKPAVGITEEDKVNIYKEVASGLAMALKEPVNVILGQSQLARNKSEDSELADHYIAIEREARRVRMTIENLIKVSGSEKAQLHREDLHEIVLLALKEVRPEIQSYGVQIRKDLRPVGQVLVDAAKLKTAIVELLKNSIESMVESADKEIYLLIKDEGKVLSLLIQDTGPGISDDNLSKVFSPFYSTKEGLEHKGLGLSVAKGIVESCSGKMRVDSSGTQGTRFVIEFPLIKAGAESADGEVSVEVPLSEDTNSQVVKISGLEGSLPEIEATELAGASPLTGTDADSLPTVPSEEEDAQQAKIKMQQKNEVTPAERMADFVNDQFSEQSAMDQDLALISDSDDFDEDGEVQEDESSDFTVTIRKPKVGSGE